MPKNKGKNTDPNSEYVLLIALLRQKWLRERASNVKVTRTLSVLFRTGTDLPVAVSYHNAVQMPST
jgi:hypothetical protein